MNSSMIDMLNKDLLFSQKIRISVYPELVELNDIMLMQKADEERLVWDQMWESSLLGEKKLKTQNKGL